MDKSHDNELRAFREEWKYEIKKQHQVFSVENNDTVSDETDGDHRTTSKTQHQLPCNESNLQKTQLPSKKPKLVPLLTLDIPSYQLMQNDRKTKDESPTTFPVTQNDSCHTSNNDFISLLIRDIDEMTTVPFFDISLPKEVCLRIFSYLDMKELCHCACVSKAWSPLANDELIWYNVYKRLGFKELGKTTQEQSDWKGLVRNSILRQWAVTKNWKERICQIQTLEYEKGISLSACKMYNTLLIAGYANGKTCLWNVENNWKQSLEATPEVFQDPAKASVECVSVAGDVCATGFTCGIVNVWHTDISTHPIYQYSLTKPAQHLVLTSSRIHLFTCFGSDIRVDKVQDGQWAFSKSKSFDSQITFVSLLPDDTSEATFAVAMKEDIFLYNIRNGSLTDLDKISGTKITAVTSNSECVAVAVGWAPFGFGVGTEFAAKVRLYDTKTGKHLQSLLGHYADITCLGLCCKDGLVTGSKDRRVRVYDTRTEQPKVNLQGHSSPVTTVQMDSWKVVSGAFDGTLKVWDTRMGALLWETRANNAPVRLCQFDSDRLVTANIPLDKVPNESMWYADDLILHRRHRGSVHVYDFGSNSETGMVPEEMRSNYDDIAGYNYNITLVAPYDALTN